MSDSPTAALLIIGAEILSGKVEDQNAPFLTRALFARGVEVVEIRVIGDVVDTIVGAVRELSPRVTHLFTTGGIGPTHDDVTVGAVAAAYGRPLAQHPELTARLRGWYGERLTAAHLRLADVPQGAEVLLGAEKLLPVIRVANTCIFPGVPALLRLCFERVAPTLSGTPFVSRALLLDASETAFAEGLAAVQHAHPDVAIGSYPRFDDGAPYRVKITIDGRDGARVAAAMADVRAIMRVEWLLGESA